MKRTRNFVINLILLTGLSFAISCETTVVDAPRSYPAGSYSEIFESFWTGMNNNYVFWCVDQTNWDEMYATYQPLFANMTEINAANDNIAEGYFTEMTKNLIDSHYTLTFSASGHQVSPAYNRKILIHQQYPDSIYSFSNTFFDSVYAKYLAPLSVKIGTDTIETQGSKFPMTAVTGRINSNNNILYFGFNAFYLSDAGDNVRPVIDNFLAAIANLPASTQGIIIDVRENGGGNVSDLDYLIGRMIDAPLTFGYTRTKSGSGRLDYTPKIPAIVKPQPGAVAITKPVVILADHLSISMAELTVLAVRALPKGIFIGTTTWGANGPLATNEYFNSGQFDVGDSSKPYVSVYTSSALFETLDGTMFEGRGIGADIWVKETSAAYANNVDLQLEAAIHHIENQ